MVDHSSTLLLIAIIPLVLALLSVLWVIHKAAGRDIQFSLSGLGIELSLKTTQQKGIKE